MAEPKKLIELKLKTYSKLLDKKNDIIKATGKSQSFSDIIDEAISC